MKLPINETAEQLSRFKRIGLFDSGVGGLSVLKCLSQLPHSESRSFVYLADSARCPYGNRPPQEISLFVEQIIAWMQGQSVDAIVMACNTSAAVARSVAERLANVPVFDLIAPTAKSVAQSGKRISVMATASTARSQAFSNSIKAINPGAEVIEYGCPDLVPIVESGSISSETTRQVLKRYVDRCQLDAVELVVLGCTHFPFLRSELEKLSGDSLQFVDPAQILSGTYGNDRMTTSSAHFFVTGNRQDFARTAAICLGYMPTRIEAIDESALEACRISTTLATPTDTQAPPVVPSVVQERASERLKFCQAPQ